MNSNADILPIIILNWNGFEDTRSCIQSIFDQQIDSIKIYLIDNNSKKDEQNLIKKEFSENKKIELRFNQENLGFTRAHNNILSEIIKQNYKYVLLLNNDTILEQGSLAQFISYLDQQDAGIVSCKLIKYGDKTRLDSVGHKMLSSGDIIPIGHNRHPQKYNSSFEHIGACAAATLYSTEMLKNIGLFDEYFETGYEDAELGLRAYLAGYRCLFDPNIIVFHKINRSIRRIFDLNYAIKIQLNIFYTYLKLVHWPIIVLNFIPWLIRLIGILIISILLFRKKLLKVQFHAFNILLGRDWGKIMVARKQAKKFRKIGWKTFFLKQEFFIKDDLRKFFTFVIKGKISHLENF